MPDIFVIRRDDHKRRKKLFSIGYGFTSLCFEFPPASVFAVPSHENTGTQQRRRRLFFRFLLRARKNSDCGLDGELSSKTLQSMTQTVSFLVSLTASRGSLFVLLLTHCFGKVKLPNSGLADFKCNAKSCCTAQFTGITRSKHPRFQVRATPKYTARRSLLWHQTSGGEAESRCFERYDSVPGLRYWLKQWSRADIAGELIHCS